MLMVEQRFCYQQLLPQQKCSRFCFTYENKLHLLPNNMKYLSLIVTVSFLSSIYTLKIMQIKPFLNQMFYFIRQFKVFIFLGYKDVGKWSCKMSCCKKMVKFQKALLQDEFLKNKKSCFYLLGAKLLKLI